MVKARLILVERAMVDLGKKSEIMGNYSGPRRTCPLLVICLLTVSALHAQTLTTLASFDGANGASPSSGMSLVQGLDGKFYGTTEQIGTVFNITPSATLTVIARPQEPYGGVVLATDQNFYGTTHIGGKYNKGTVFKVTTNGILTTLHNFGSTSGWYPAAALVQATNGSFYGTAYTGGPHFGGTIFKVTPNGKLTVLYSFVPKLSAWMGTPLQRR